MRSAKRILPAAAAATALIVTAPGSAMAADGGLVVGTGGYSPGLAVAGCPPQTVWFSGTMVLVGHHLGTYSFLFQGSSTACETPVSGSGSGTVSGGISGALAYTRIGNRVSYSGSVSMGGETETAQVWECVRTYTSANPVLSYADICHLVLV